MSCLIYQYSILFFASQNGGPGRNRTASARFRKPLLYPIQLQAHFCLQKQSNRSIENRQQITTLRLRSIVLLLYCSISLFAQLYYIQGTINCSAKIEQSINRKQIIDSIFSIAFYCSIVLFSNTLNNLSKITKSVDYIRKTEVFQKVFAGKSLILIRFYSENYQSEQVISNDSHLLLTSSCSRSKIILKMQQKRVMCRLNNSF